MNGRRRQSGQSAQEFVVVVPLVLVLLLGGLQVAILYRARLTLNLATFEAARRGAVSNATWEAANFGFARSMSALYVPGAEGDEILADGAVDAALDRGLLLSESRAALPWWELEPGDPSSPVCIERVNPANEAIETFAYTGTPDGAPREIPNDNLMFRSRSVPVGDGSLSVQDLNLLHLRISYCHPMIVPIAGRLISSVRLFGVEPAGTQGDENGLNDLTSYLTPEESAGQGGRPLSAFE